jgi:4'-phosphopantetheinyl transferase
VTGRVETSAAGGRGGPADSPAWPVAPSVSMFPRPPLRRADRGELVAGCRIWLVDLTASDDDYARAYKLLSGEEHARATSIRSVLARRRFVLARAAVRVRLSDLLCVAPKQVTLCIGDHGKPEFARQWVARVTRNPPRFNLAHGDGVALLAVHPRHDVGVDIERIAPAGERPWRRLLERICHPSELAEATAEARWGPHAFYERWVGKEAVLKALGPGLRISPAAVSLRRDGAGALWVRELPSRRALATGVGGVETGMGEGGVEMGIGGGGAAPAACRLVAVRTPPGFVGAVALVDRGARAFSHAFRSNLGAENQRIYDLRR